MSIHDEVLRTVRRLCSERGHWTFTQGDVIRALPHLNERSVRTHIVSRCCVNAPRHHPHKWDYFRRIRRGLYELVPQYRKEPRLQQARVVGQERAYSTTEKLKDSVHVAITKGERTYVAECLEIAVVAQGETLDEMVYDLREAVILHLEGENPGAWGISSNPRLVFTWELPLDHDHATKT